MSHMANFRILGYLVMGVLSVYLLNNIISSQDISPTYFNLVNGDEMAVATYLKSIKSLPEYDMELAKYKEAMPDVEIEIFKDDLEKRTLITNFERILEKNPSSRDALYNLYLLNSSSGDQNQALEYLRRAREIDPEIN